MDADALSRENAHLKARLAEVEAALAEVQEANRRLEDILRSSQRAQFGRRSEKLSPDQFNLPLEDAELAQGVLEAAQEKAESALRAVRGETPRKPARNRGHLPPDLPRIERVIEPASTLCPCGCGAGPDRRGRLRTARRDPRAVPGSGHAASPIRLPPLFASRGTGACARACRARRAADRAADCLDHRLEVRGSASICVAER